MRCPAAKPKSRNTGTLKPLNLKFWDFLWKPVILGALEPRCLGIFGIVELLDSEPWNSELLSDAYHKTGGMEQFNIDNMQHRNQVNTLAKQRLGILVSWRSSSQSSPKAVAESIVTERNGLFPALPRQACRSSDFSLPFRCFSIELLPVALWLKAYRLKQRGQSLSHCRVCSRFGSTTGAHEPVSEFGHVFEAKFGFEERS